MKRLFEPQRVTFVRGAVGGIGAFAFGYLLTWILAGTKIANTVVSGPLGSTVPDWKAVFWVFYDSHFVGTRTPEVFGPGGALWGGGDLLDTVGLLGVEYLFVVPVVVLVVAGATAATLAGARNLREGTLAGITIGIGYLVAVVLGLFPITHGGIAPSPLRAIIVAGIVYPITFGAIGGVIAGIYAKMAAERGDDIPVESS